MSRPYSLNAAVVGAFGASGLLLADSAIKGAGLLVIASIVAFVLRRDSAATRHWVWLVAIVALLLVPLMSAVLPRWRVLPAWATMSEIGDSSNAGFITGSTENASSVGRPVESFEPAASSLTYVPASNQPADTSAEKSAAVTQPTVSVGAETSSQAVVDRNLHWRWLWFVPWCWAIGVAALMMRLTAARVLLWHSERRSFVIHPLSTHALDSAIFNTFRDACLQLGIRRSITLLIHPQKTIPVVWGILRHRLLLPEVARQWSEEQLRSVLLHELAHIKRRDALSQLLAQTACAFHWFNPLVWFAAWRLHVERERACDDLVLASGVRASAYAEHLLNVATRLTSSPWTQACGLAMARHSSLQGRLAAVLNARQNRRSVTSALLAFLFMAGAAIAVPVAMMSSEMKTVASDPESEKADEKAGENTATKKPLDPWAYNGVDVALLKRWQQLEEDDSIPESRVNTLRSAMERFLQGIDASPFSLTQVQIEALKKLQTRGSDKSRHTASETQDWIKAVFAIHGEPIQMAFNEAPWLGTPGNAAELSQLAFGPPDASGLRVALVCQKGEFIFGDSARLDLRLWNTGKETILVGIGRDGPGLYPKLELQATDRNGQKIATKFGPESQMIKDTHFAKSWQLRPGETADVYGYRLRVGSNAPREAEGFPEWYTLIEMPDVKSGDEILLAGVIPALTRTAQSSSEKLQTESIRIKATAPEEVEIWTAHSAGKWPMPGGVTLEVKRELFHGSDVATSVVLTWPEDATGTTHAFSSSVASDAFASREPWNVAWERNSSSFWTIRGNLGDRGPGRAKLFCVNRIDFADKSKIMTTTWYHRPDEMPMGIQRAFEKVFEPLPSTPRRASEADGSVRVEQAHDVRPIEELLHGEWKSSSSDLNVHMTFPEQDTGEIHWSINYGKGIPVIEAKLSRIRSPADNSIRLWMQPSQLPNVDEKDIVGVVRRGPDSTLLLDITGSPRFPDYKKTMGVVLVRMSAPQANLVLPNQNGVAASLPAGLEQHLEWSEPTAGLRAALMIRSVESPGKLGKERKIFLVVQNVSDQPIRYCDSEIHETKVPAADVEGRTLYLKDNGEILVGMQRAVSTHTDIVLQPRGVHVIDMFDSEQEKAIDRKTGDSIAEGIMKYPTEALFAKLKIVHAPEGAWTGMLTTPTTRGAFAAEGKMPSSQEGQTLFRYCIDHARLNGEIPGGLISRLRDLVLEFIRLNTGDQSGEPYAKKMQPLLARFERKGDWKQADVVSLFDEIAAVTTIPLQRTMNAIRENSMQRGQALPTSLKDANWGEALPGGLRMAWVLEPREKQVHLGSSLKSRLVLHNAGQESVIFVTRSFHQPEHKAMSASGAAIQMDSTYWTTIGRPEPYRLRPGESCEVYAPGIGIGAPNTASEDWSNVRAGTWMLASAGDDVTFRPGAIKLTGDHNEQIDPDWWLKFITERVNRDAPIPADSKEREVILFRVISDLFGGSPTPEEASAFLSDNSPDAASNLAKLLSTRNRYKSVTGSILSGEVKFRVLPEDPSVATRPRVTMNPGNYNLRDEMRFVVSRRPVGERIVNEADIVWYPPSKDKVSTKVPLPIDYDTWAAGWSPNSTILWVSQKGLLRSYDFTDKTTVKETRYEGEQIATAPIPADVREALRGALEKAVPQQKPAAQPPAALAPSPSKPLSSVRTSVTEPKSELSKMIMEEWRRVARSDGKIPGGTVSALESAVKEYRTNFPKLTTILSQFDANRDWTEAEVIALLDAVSEIESLPINSLINEYRLSKPANIQLGKPLPNDLANAAWGKPQKNGLRSAFLIEPQAKEYAIGSVVNARVLIHNSGKDPVTFLFPRHAVPDGIRVRDAKIHIVPWTHFIAFSRVRLDPGHYIEEDGFDVAIEDHYDDQKANSRVVLEGKSGSEFHLSFAADLTETILQQPDGLKDPEAIRLRTIANRVAEEAPLPASSADRELLLRHVVLDMFGEPPTADEIAEFVKEDSPDALTKLTARLQTRKAADFFSGEILSGELTIRVAQVAKNANTNTKKAP